MTKMEDIEALPMVLGWRPDSFRMVKRGYTPVARYVVSNGTRRAFVKIATTAHTGMLLRREIAAYQVLRDAPRPTLIGYSIDRDMPILAVEDLSDAMWPPPWTDERVSAAVTAIRALHGLRVDLPSFEIVHGGEGNGWRAVQADPLPFLALGLVTADWLRRALPALIEAEAACSTNGVVPCHWDLRSDNMCLVNGTMKLVDWAEACLSNPQLDLGFWLPSLAYEGGPSPEAILPHAPDIAAWVSGYFAARAGLPIIPNAPFVRRVQQEQLSTALPWAVRALRL
ncbi:aminoglycoside phosphotransferase family protein [Gluconacetobacter asukensis]|uniref:Aminoglycoside phosphotransferase family protein n=1 Tax=Gluconacetobacter asukensis TaxID=1017181 RepID=A0A7W4P230_9PROT|nr:aminoglycoside phosphotransferase family protein [Gluconacetobacter asukensis]MBB2171330.1 aminoglycoside phosphotransferase family protein [Gluconacetobacter asukensis]